MTSELLRQTCKVALICVVTFVGLSTVGDRFCVESRAQKSSTAAQTSRDREAIDEAREPEDPSRRADRAAKNARYDSQVNATDLTSLPPDSGVVTIACGMHDPTILPSGSHDVIVLGMLVSKQPYLSANRTEIYTEYQLDIEEVFKPTLQDLSLVQGRLIIDRPGGVLRMGGGPVIASYASGTRLARPLDVGRRYVLFCRLIHDKYDLVLGYAFELLEGKVYALWERHGYDRLASELQGADASLAEERAFLDAVRDAAKHPDSARHFSAPRN